MTSASGDRNLAHLGAEPQDCNTQLQHWLTTLLWEREERSTPDVKQVTHSAQVAHYQHAQHLRIVTMQLQHWLTTLL